MKATKDFNNISAKLQAEIPKLKSGEKVIFQMLNGVPNPDPDERERAKSPILYGKVQLQTSQKIFDPYHKEIGKNEKGETQYQGDYVDIGVVEQWNALGDRPEKCRCFIPGQGQGSQFQGKFELVGGNHRDEQLYEVLWLSNEREGNPYRDQSVEPLFKIVNQKADSQKSLNKFDQLKKALDRVNEITKPENLGKARKIMASLNQPTYTDDIVLSAKIKELATTNPEIFNKTFDDPTIDVKFLVKSALDSGVIIHDIASGDLKMGNVKVGKIQVSNPSVLVDEITNWMATVTNGKDVLENIQKQLKLQEAGTSSK